MAEGKRDLGWLIGGLVLLALFAPKITPSPLGATPPATSAIKGNPSLHPPIPPTPPTLDQLLPSVEATSSALMANLEGTAKRLETTIVSIKPVERTSEAGAIVDTITAKDQVGRTIVSVHIINPTLQTATAMTFGYDFVDKPTLEASNEYLRQRLSLLQAGILPPADRMAGFTEADIQKLIDVTIGQLEAQERLLREA